MASRVEIGAALNKFRQELTQLAAGHEPRRNFCHGNTRCLRNVRHGARGSRVHFQHVHLATLSSISRIAISARNRELNIHQSYYLQGACQLEGVLAHPFQQMWRNVDCGQHARRIAGMYASLFDVLHDPANHNVFTVRQRVDVDFNRVFQKVIDQHRAVVRILHRFFHVANDRFFVVGNHHGASAKHIRRPHQHGISDPTRAINRFVNGGGHHPGRLRDLQLFEQFIEMFSVFSQVNGFRRRTDNVHASGLQGQRQVQRRLSSELHDHAHWRALRRFVLVDRPNVLKRQRLEVEPVAGIVVGRDRFRIAIDHDRLVPVIAQRERRVATAVVELNSLPDAIGAAAENDDFLLICRSGFVFLFVGRIKIRCEAFKLRGASVDALIDRHHAVLLAQVAHLLLPFQAPGGCQPAIGESHALRFPQHLGGDRLHRMLFQFQLLVVDFF